MKKTIYTSTQNAYTETGYFIITDVFKNTIMIPSSYVREWESMYGELTNKRHKEIIVDSIKTAVLDGTTYYYLQSDNEIYRASLKVNQNILPFLTTNDEITITYKEANINEIISIE